MSMFSLCFFQYVFDSGGRSSHEFITKSINYKQTSLPLKEKILSYYKVDLHSNDLCSDDFNLYFSL